MSKLVHEGGCLCGALRFRTSATPVRVMACHCSTCKRRTGSAFGVGVYFHDADVTLLAGTPTHYEFHSVTSGRWLRNDSCGICGSTISWTLEMRPGIRGVAGGCFDVPSWFRIERHIWTGDACRGMAYADDVDVHEAASPS